MLVCAAVVFCARAKMLGKQDTRATTESQSTALLIKRKTISYCTINCPRNMFIPQTNENVPPLVGMKVRTTS